MTRSVLQLKIVFFMVLWVVASGCDKRQITQYEFAGTKWQHETYLPDRYHDPADQRQARAYFLYEEGNLREALECFKQLFETQHKVDAKTMCGVIYTRWKQYYQAEDSLKDAITSEPKSAWPRLTLVWSLSERGRLDDAEQAALELAKMNNSESAWKALTQVRTLKQSQQEWNAFCRFLLLSVCVLLLASPGIGVGYFLWNVCLRRVYQDAKLRSELRAICRNAIVSSERASAQLVKITSLSEAAELVHQRAIDAHLQASAIKLDGIEELVGVYQEAMAQLDSLQLNAADKAIRRRELERELKTLMTRLVADR